MSYIQRMGDLEFSFQDEESYLNARLEFLQANLGCAFDVFLRQKMYDEDKCVLESWRDITSPMTYVNFSENVGTSTNPAYTYTDASAPQEPLTIQDLHAAFATIDTTTVDVTTANDTSTVWTTNTIEDMWGNTNVSNNPCGEVPINNFKSEKKNVKKEEPIESRFDILDL